VSWIFNNGCDEGTNRGLRLWDITTNNWTTQYDVPAYSGTATTAPVPSAVFKAIGGGPSGHATVTAPANGYDTAPLATVFAAAFSSYTANSTATAAPSGDSSGGHSNTGAIVGGVIGGVVLIALIIGGLLFYRRRKRSTQAQGHGQMVEAPANHPDTPAPTYTSSAGHPGIPEKDTLIRREMPGSMPVHEMSANGTNIHELSSESGHGSGMGSRGTTEPSEIGGSTVGKHSVI
jgi:hypothetical protein